MVKLTKPRWEIVAQRIALGDTREEAYVKAGFKACQASGSNCSRLLKRSPEILERVRELQNLANDKQVETQLIGKREVINALIENITAAKKGKPVYNKKSELVGWARDFSSINQGLKIIADLEGLVVRHSRQEVVKKDEIETATPTELLQIVNGAFVKLGVEVDLASISKLIKSTEETGESGGGDDEESSSVLPPLPETAGESYAGASVSIPALDGWKPTREVGSGIG